MDTVIENTSNKILVKNAHGYQIINFNDIIFCESMGSYTLIYLINDEKVLSSHILKEVENQLPANLFFRVNRSYLVNINFIKCYNCNPYKSVVLQNKKEIKISVRKNSKFLTFLRKKFPLV
ncbi:MAG: LytTR family transcriptional regulator [Cyclobacteriaceae bacterium]|nr:LytTR family transcriptional regulator [Cyclobacteriaceae bacterium]